MKNIAVIVFVVVSILIQSAMSEAQTLTRAEQNELSFLNSILSDLNLNSFSSTTLTIKHDQTTDGRPVTVYHYTLVDKKVQTERPLRFELIVQALPKFPSSQGPFDSESLNLTVLVGINSETQDAALLQNFKEKLVASKKVSSFQVNIMNERDLKIAQNTKTPKVGAQKYLKVDMHGYDHHASLQIISGFLTAFANVKNAGLDMYLGVSKPQCVFLFN